MRAHVIAPAGLALTLAASIILVSSGQAPRFFPDDPLARAPETQDAAGAEPADIGLAYDLSYNLFVTPRRDPSGTKAQNINTIDEVPDSSWFTNRIGSRPLTRDELLRGSIAGPGPDASRWTVIRPKTSGFAPGFTAKDAAGETWFLSFDPPSNPKGATAALVIANRIFWALGYNQLEAFLTRVDPARLDIDPTATMRRPSGERTTMTRSDVEEVFERSARNLDGTYEAAGTRLLGGKVLGPFRYEGTRPDDPNDIVPHEHRRELRALRVFGAWTNLTDLKAGNTLDTLVDEGGRKVIKHYLQDVGSTFGMGANGPHDWDEGFEYFYEGAPTLRRMLTLGFWLSPWQTARYPVYESVGRFEGDAFDPTTWRPHAATKAYIEMRADDAFWAARRVMAFSDDAIRAVVSTGQLTDAVAEQHLVDVLIKRRDAIGRAYLPAINPVVEPAWGADGTLTFRNAAVDAGVAPAPESYRAVWHRFDNATGVTSALGDASSREPRMQAPAGLPANAGAYVQVDLSANSAAHPAWAQPAVVHFRRTASGWQLVGLERLPSRQPD
jgi:hypothetical protein